VVYFLKGGFTSCGVAAGVMQLILRDQRANNLTFNGFPQVLVESQDGETFHITLSWYADIVFTQTCEMDKPMAKRFAKNYSKRKKPLWDDFALIQTLLANMEYEIRHSVGI